MVPSEICSQQAIVKALEYFNDGYIWIVDIDLEKFFDNVPQDKLMSYIHEVINDGDVESLIRKYLQAGVMVNDRYEHTDVGTPQGGNLSPLLSNIMLTKLDKELEARGLRFTRYADEQYHHGQEPCRCKQSHALDYQLHREETRS